MTEFWKFHQLRQMHIELTNACNAACPMCVRFYNNSRLTRPDLQIGQIRLEKFKQYFPPEVIKACDLILFCGVHGDPCVATDMLEICEYIQSCSPDTAVRVNTNGGMRDPEWWHRLGKLFANEPRGQSVDHWQVTFSVDGLEDTNHVYRRNVVWSRLQSNFQAFIAAGGTAVWDYLIFEHNEHQILEAQQLSKQWGFYEFVPKKALGVDDGEYLMEMPALDRKGSLEYTIKAPRDSKNRNLSEAKGTKPLRFYGFSQQFYEQQRRAPMDYQKLVNTVYDTAITPQLDHKYSCEISCKAQRPRGGMEIFVDNFGRVMPCCYVGTHLNGRYSDAASLQLHKHMNDYGWHHFSLDNHSLEEIMDAGHLDRVFADSWSKTASTGKLIYCANTCGAVSAVDKIYTHELNHKAATHDREESC